MSDHRELGQSMDLFHFEEESPAMVFWHPLGHRIYRKIENYIREQHRVHGYEEIRTPMILNRSLWELSGHWEKFQEEMFVIPSDENNPHTYALKPMSCPAHIQVYQRGLKSYRDLPERLFEFGVCHRNEPSGAILGMMRLRQFTQDDSHIFCTEDQILGETKNYIDMLRKTYKMFGYEDFSIKFSTRPKNSIGSKAVWEKAEKSLENACKELGLDFELNPGHGAFYGPKLDFVLKDSLGREWQCGTIQIDFNLAKRLGATYIDKDGKEKHPVLIHHAVLGSLERWTGILLEHYNGHLPLWLAPIQIVVIPVSEKFTEYAAKVEDWVKKSFAISELYTILDTNNEKVGKKIALHSKAKVPVIIVVGEREETNNTITIREHGVKENREMNLSYSSAYFRDQINKSRG